MGMKSGGEGGLICAPPGKSIPGHIAIILDGNGRWAKARGLPRTAGHAAGAETFRRIASYCRDIGVKHLTVYAFSTENWKRPLGEVSAIMELLEQYLDEAIEKMESERIKLRVIGERSGLAPQLLRLIEKIDDLSGSYEGCQANICINYGGRDDIVRAAMRYAEDYRSGAAGELTEQAFKSYLYLSDVPDPDLVIRPGGELRLSNFLIWESAYSELYFTDVLWPDFCPADIDAAIADYCGRDRRFGGIKT